MKKTFQHGFFLKSASFCGTDEPEDETPTVTRKRKEKKNKNGSSETVIKETLQIC